MFINRPHFSDESAARRFLESKIWPNGPTCPHCSEAKRIYRLKSKRVRPGVYRCGNPDCRKDFTVTVGTIMERSHIPLRKWLLAMYLFSASKKGISAKQLERMLEVNYRTAWFLCHRIREAMKEDFTVQIGGPNKVIEADETFWGTQFQKSTTARGYAHKMKVVTLVERKGPARSFVVKNVDTKTVGKILAEQVCQQSILNTDEAAYYHKPGELFARHDRVNHGAGEYARGKATTNLVEGYFSLFKRGLVGTYHKVGSQHLHRYCAEFDFRWNTRKVDDHARVDAIVGRVKGKRLYYKKQIPRLVDITS